jgi:hypothetical protein
MISLLSLALLGQTMTLFPSDDIWVYPHASDGASDGFLRVWGVDGRSVPADAGEAEEFSLGILRFSLMGTPVGQKLTTATLVVNNVPKPGFSAEQSKAAPLEARAVHAGFAEKGWEYSKVGAVLPARGSESLYGTGWATDVAGDSVAISIDLLNDKGDFSKALENSQKDPAKVIAIALTSRINPSELGRSAIYKLFSKEEKDEKLRPRLILTWE